MSKFVKCLHGGNDSCIVQGGDGSLYHTPGYIHPFVNSIELDSPVEDYTQKVFKSVRSVVVPDLDTHFDEDNTSALLSISIDRTVSILEKSLYDFDLDTPEGVTKILGLLPIMDPAVMMDIMGEIWIGFVGDDLDPDLMRAEIRGYLLDWLDNNEVLQGE